MNLNVCGILSKLHNELFFDECVKYDILCFTESKINDVDNEKVKQHFDAAGYKVYFKNRSKMNRIRSGGIMIACKNEIAKYVKECNSPCNFVKWIRLSKELTGYNENLLLGTVYIPPRQSPFACDEVYERIEADLSNVVREDDLVLLCGDFNSHTSAGADYVEIDDVHGLPSSDIKQTIVSCGANLVRISMDRSKDTYGQKLLDMCKNTNMLILNGRIGCDKLEGKTLINKNTLYSRLLCGLSTYLVSCKGIIY